MTTTYNNENIKSPSPQLPEEQEPTLIVLKYNSEEPGKIPSSSDLEIGELALGLCKGSEAIWAKNSEGEVINLRTPSADLYWGDLLVTYNSKEEFKKDLEAGEISESKLFCIKDSRQIWTQGTYFGLSEEEINTLIEDKVYILPSKTSELIESSTSEEISEVFGGDESFKQLVENLRGKVSIAAIKIGNSFAPVTISTRFGEQNIFSITLEWIYQGKYYTETISLDNGASKEFKVERDESKSSIVNLDKLLEENKELIIPKISCSWKFYNKSLEQISVYPSPDLDNPVVEKGYRVVFSGTYSWISKEGKKDPVSLTNDSAWTKLTESGEESSMFTSTFITEDTTIKVGLEAPKTGLMVRGEDVVSSNGELDVTEDTRTVRFGDRIYYGPSIKGKNEEDFVEYDIRSLSETRIVLDGEIHTTTAGKITTDPNKYYVIGIPASLGELKGIWGDGFPIMGAFHKLNNVIEVINAAGIGINYNVYVSNNPGAFTNVTIEFM